jgi:hypothetical protein
MQDFSRSVSGYLSLVAHVLWLILVTREIFVLIWKTGEWFSLLRASGLSRIMEKNILVVISELYLIKCVSHFLIDLKSIKFKVYLIQHYMIKFVSDMRQVGGFLRVQRFPTAIKLTCIRTCTLQLIIIIIFNINSYYCDL